MCGRYLIITEDEIIEMRAILQELNSRYSTDYYMPLYKTGEISPTDNAPIIALSKNKDNEVVIDPFIMKWGFKKWDKSSNVIFNARSESVLQKPFFSNYFNSFRCIVPSNGFFEWKKFNDKKSEKYFFNIADNKMLYLAGLFKPIIDQKSQVIDYQFVILTKKANESMMDIHNRMPVVIDKNQINDYLYDKNEAIRLMINSNPIFQRMGV